MKKKGKELIFISRINRDGKGVTDLSNEDMKHEKETIFNINGLSLSKGHYIACEMNCYVVKFKKPQ